jgi:hypothetical protein
VKDSILRRQVGRHYLAIDPDLWWGLPPWERRRVRQLILGLPADLPRKNCWTIAEHAGDTTPDGLQHLLGRAKWDAGLVRDDLRDYVLEHLADDQAVLVVDETGDLKKGTHTVGVQRQYTGTAGRIENAQVAVYLTYTSRHGHAAIDRALYLPKSWTSAPDRCELAAVPDLPRPHPVRPSACRPLGQAHPAPGLAETVRRTRREGAPLVRLGAGRHHHGRTDGPSAPDDPP